MWHLALHVTLPNPTSYAYPGKAMLEILSLRITMEVLRHHDVNIKKILPVGCIMVGGGFARGLPFLTFIAHKHVKAKLGDVYAG